jgi:catechol 2,3-dioxygenase-like lactoylglutathione lyase family enzyme
LQHVALNVADLGACERFYCGALGMRVLWRPDEQNVFLTNGSDNLALHRTTREERAANQSLDHIGFVLERAKDVDAWYEFLSAHGISILSPPGTHRDGTRSLYCKDPDGNTVQLLYEPRSIA